MEKNIVSGGTVDRSRFVFKFGWHYGIISG